MSSAKVRRKDWHNIARELRDHAESGAPIKDRMYLDGLKAGQEQMISAMKLFCRDNGVAFKESEWNALLKRPGALYGVKTDRPTVCEECDNEELHEYEDTDLGITGVGCDTCGWSWDDPK